MRQITRSPYEGNESAEVGERLFEYTQSLMDPDKGLSSSFRESGHGPSNEAIEVFGEERARTIIKTVRSVSLSGILYSCGWTEGTIQQRHCGILEKELLLLCLHDHRIARTTATGIKHVIKDLGAWEILSDAVSQWKLVEKYPLLARCKNINLFKRKNQAQCFKCVIFVARAVICMKYLQWDFLAISNGTSLKRKVFACFDILESLLKVTKKVSIQKPTSPVDVDTFGSAHGIVDSGNKPAHHQSDLSCRLRSKQYKIKYVQIHPGLGGGRSRKFHITKENTDTTTFTVPAAVSDEESKRKRSFEKISSSSLLGERKRQTIPFSHALFETKENAIQNSSVSHMTTKKSQKGILSHELIKTKNNVTQNGIRDDSTCNLRHNENGKSHCTSRTNKNAKRLSLALFDKKSDDHRRIKNGVKVFDMPKTFALSMNQEKPPYVSDGSTLHSNSSNPDFWYPVDKKELILNPIQIETAWLVEESMYCSRKTDVDWSFVMKYASPSLQIQLRKIPYVSGNHVEEILSKLFQNGIETKRFKILRGEIRRKLLKNVVRMRMEGILPRLRRATHPLLVQKNRLKRTAAAAGATESSRIERHVAI